MRFFFLLLFLFSFHGFIFPQAWEYNIYKDYVYKLRDRWGDSQKYIAKFTVSNDSVIYFHQIKGEKDNWINVVFPEDFTLIKGEKNNFPQKFIVLAQVLKETIFIDTIDYYPGPKGYFQLTPIEIPQQIMRILNNQVTIDSYTWEDSLGVNYFIRTKNKTENSKHIYFYHFLEVEQIVVNELIEKNGFLLNRKHVDFVKNCDDFSKTEHLLESIQITDLNEDNIAEIICSYDVGCTNMLKKILLMTDGEKYLIRENKNNVTGYKIGNVLMKETEFMRFMQKKWEYEGEKK